MNQADGASPRRPRRARRPVAARRFTGVGRHGPGDTAAVLAALAAAEEEAAPSSATPQDEFDLPEAVETTVHASSEEDPSAPLADGEVTQEFFLHEAEAASEAVDHHGSGFADALNRFGVDVSNLPAGYLPAADLFSDPDEGEIDLKARKKRRRKRGWITTVVVLVVLAAVGGAGWFGVSRLMAPAADYAGPGSGKVSFSIAEGAGVRQIGKDLEKADVVKSADAFYDAVDGAETTPIFQPGEFNLRKHMSAASALESLAQSTDKVSYFQIQANARMSDALSNISEGTGIDLEELRTAAEKPEEFGLPSSVKSLEGYLHPGEYRMPLDTDAKTILKKLVDDTTKSLEKQGVTDPDAQYRVLKLASVVAGEGTSKDYKRISGIIDNRLKPNDETHGYLQLDSTVSYGLGQVSIHLTKDQLKDKNNPFNTYVHKGLTPTPIGSPGDRAIEAAVNPTASDDFYWVTVNLSTGETKFAPTYEQHQKNVKEYRTWCSDNPDVCK
ncbi:MAG: endolytic transglycosylase MltG [Galactobacter sp.]|uniref:endolytic transglycosylase MltG n=1 Tax=Galactobacter sp. TaxID=2676125 RepID=UPI0025C03DA5|nr:endolytic transglycosylase MltG [Galactobacter sp.]